MSEYVQRRILMTESTVLTTSKSFVAELPIKNSTYKSIVMAVGAAGIVKTSSEFA